MPTYTKTLLSGSTNGLYITVAASSSPGTLIHTAVSGTTSLDEIWLYATNPLSSAYELTLEFGEAYDGMMSTGAGILVTVPAKSGQMLIIPGLLLQNSKVIRAYVSGSSNTVKIYGYVNRITP